MQYTSSSFTIQFNYIVLLISTSLHSLPLRVLCGFLSSSIDQSVSDFSAFPMDFSYISTMVDLTSMNRYQKTIMGTAVCVLLTVFFSVKLLLLHLSNWKNAKEQKAIIIIIFMAPLYAIVSFIGLVDFLGTETFFLFLETIKECYEAFVIAKFLSLLYHYLNISISKHIVPDETKGREIHHTFPMTLFQPHTVHLDTHTLKLLKNWTRQFVVIRPVCSILMIALKLVDVYPSWVSWTFTIILNVSVSLALYSLVLFYHAFEKELEPHHPLPKFMCIKGIVFFCFWQGIILDILVKMGIIQSHHFWLDVAHLQEAYQNTLVCVEMVGFVIVQQHAYSAAPYSKIMEKKKKQ